MATLKDLAVHWLDRVQPYRPSAFWFWNAGMDPAAMAETVGRMAAAGIREFLIHPVHGLEIEYLSDEFFDRYRHALRLAKQHHLKVWVYDEYGWPSGVAGGKLLREHPEHRGWYLDFAKDEQGKVVATPRQSDRVLDNVMGAPWTRNETGYLDTLSLDAVRCFIDLTHERIYRECGDLFTEVVAGFFTDEPVDMMNAGPDQPGCGLWSAVGMPWTPTLPDAFRKRFGYAIEPRYPELAGPGPSAIKRDYWTLVKEMHRAAYHGQIARWCQDHGVKYTGHLGEDEPLRQVRFAGSPFQALSLMDEPGVDFLGWSLDVDQRLADMVLVPSIARHAGRERVYCEAYGISPFDLRLGPMLRTAEMLGIYGIDDIALMGFHQALDGMRKYLYWPPIFHQAPWWPFYSEFRDAFARSVGLTALGKRRARYAILYPQNALEQTDLFLRDMGSPTDPGGRMMDRLGRAVYAAGETYEFIFPEILDQARVERGAIVFPHAEYEAILAPGDIAFFDESVSALDRIAAAGGRVYREPQEPLIAAVKAARPEWADRLQISNRTGDLRVYRFEFPDGELVALRNAGGEDLAITLSSSRCLTEWVPTAGSLVEAGHEAAAVLPPHSCRYFTLTVASLGGRPARKEGTPVPVETRWQVSTDLPNMARLSNVRFRHEGAGWLDAVPIQSGGMKAPYRIGLPGALAGQERIAFQAQFTCPLVPERLGIVFERGRLEDLRVNDRPVDLTRAEPLKVWDDSCAWIDIRSLVRTGTNRVTGVLKFQAYETSTNNNAFFSGPHMPACNVCVAGAFRFLDCTLLAGSGDPRPLPLNLSMAGWEQYAGILTLSGTISIDGALAKRIRGLELTLIAEDAVEVLLDGVSLGKRITGPYRLDIEPLAPGSHRLEVRITGTSGNILHDPSPWGLMAAHWLCRD